MRTLTRYSKVAGLLIACVVAIVVATPAPAFATFGTQAEWSAFPELRQGRYTGSDLVRLWQLIVWSDGTTGKACDKFADGQFGPNTYAHTRTWQSQHGVGVDGQVGPQTWGRAKANLQFQNSSYHDLTNNGTGTKVYSFYYDYVGANSRFLVSWGWTDHFRNGYWTHTVYDPWQFHYCGPYWRYVSW